jgi:hypothetical protein
LQAKERKRFFFEKKAWPAAKQKTFGPAGASNLRGSARNAPPI